MLSIIVPAYNAEKTIEKCILSIEKYICVKKEIIIVNDGSTDNTEEVCNKLALNYNDIVFLSKNNEGVSKARMYGVNKAKYKNLMFVDSDDFLSDYIKEENISESDFIIFSSNLKDERIIISDSERNNIINSILGIGDYFKGCYLHTVWSKIYLTEKVRKIKFDTDLFHGEDMIFNIKYIKECNSIHTYGYSIYTQLVNPYSATKRYQPNIIKNDILFHSKLKKETNISQYLLNTLIISGLCISLNLYFLNKRNKNSRKMIMKDFRDTIMHEPYCDALMNYDKSKISAFSKILLFLMINNCYFISKFLNNIKLIVKKNKFKELNI